MGRVGERLKTKEEMIRDLALEPLPGEGGFFRQLVRTDKKIPCRLFSTGAEVLRPEKTAIRYLAGGEDFSALHVLEFGETFHFLDGAPATMVQLTPDGALKEECLDSANKKVFVPAGTLQGLRSNGEWTLLSCEMSPGFEYEDLRVPSREELLTRFPQHEALIRKFTR